MSRLEELINKLCPNGVRFKKISDIAATGIGLATSVTKYKSDKGVLLLHNSDIRANGIVLKQREYITEEFAQRNEKKRFMFHDLITVHTGDVGTTAVIENEFIGSIGFTTITTRINDFEEVDPYFLCYCLNSRQAKRQIERMTISDRSNLNQKSFETIVVPVPPLEVQREIVRILDDFTELTAKLKAELTAELTARKKQYQFYLDSLFSSCSGETKCLSEIGTLVRGKRFVHADAVEDNGIPCVHYGELYTYYGPYATVAKSQIRRSILQEKKLRYAQPGDVIIVGAGENDEDIGVGVSWEGSDPVAVHDACYTFTTNLNPRFISFFLRSHSYHQQIKKYVSTGKICSISAEGIGKAKLIVPSREEQNRIVSILEAFYSLTGEMESGIPAEIKARQRQYEYFRDRLLTFKEVKA